MSYPVENSDPWFTQLKAYIDSKVAGNALTFRRYATDFGLGDGTTADGTALKAAIDDMGSSYAAADTDRGAIGGVLEIPPGKWIMENSGGGLVRLPVVASGGAGDVHIMGQGRGITTLKVQGDCGYGTLTCTAASRSDNTVTVTTSTAHGLAEGDLIAIKLVWSHAVAQWTHVTVIDGGIVSPTQFKYTFGAAGSADDRIKPGTSGATAVIHKIGGLILPFGFSETRRLWLHGLTIELGGTDGEDGATTAHTNNPYTPQVGFAVLQNARVNTVDCQFTKSWAGTMSCGTKCTTWKDNTDADVSEAENTDHFYAFRCSWGGSGVPNRSHKVFVSNSKASDSNVGGTRDFTYRDCNAGIAFHSDFCVADDAALFVLTNDVYHGKSSSFPIVKEGVEGIIPSENLLIDILIGSMKFESPGNCAMIWDASRRAIVQKADQCQIRSEVSVNINGNNNNSDTTWKPWTVSTSLAVGPSIQTVTGFPTGHGLRKGEPIYVGLPADRTSDLNCGGRVLTTAANSVTFARPDYTGSAIGATAAKAGFGGGIRLGLFDVSRPKLSIDQSGSAKMSRAAFFWDFEFPPNLCTFEASLEQNQNGDACVPDVECEFDPPLDQPSRSIWIRGSRIFELFSHESSDAVDIAAGDLIELRAADRVRRSTASRVHQFVGVAQQDSPNSNAISVVASGSGTGGVTPGRIAVGRSHLWVALPGSALTQSDASGGVVVTTTGTPVLGDRVYDKGDGRVEKWNGSDTGKRLVGQLIEDPDVTTNRAGLRTCHEDWT